MNSAFNDGAGEPSRRRLIRNTGLSALAIGGLSACTNYGAQPAAPATSAGSSARTRRAEQTAPPSPKPRFRWAVARSSRICRRWLLSRRPASSRHSHRCARTRGARSPKWSRRSTAPATAASFRSLMVRWSTVPATAPLAAKNVTANGDNLTAASGAAEGRRLASGVAELRPPSPLLWCDGPLRQDAREGRTESRAGAAYHRH